MGDEKPAAVGIRACIGHGQDAGLVMNQGGNKFILKWIARTAVPGPSGQPP